MKLKGLNNKVKRSNHRVNNSQKILKNGIRKPEHKIL